VVGDDDLDGTKAVDGDGGEFLISTRMILSFGELLDVDFLPDDCDDEE